MTVYALNGLGRIGKLALKPLLERGIRPHFVTALDYHEISERFYEGLTPEDVAGVTQSVLFTDFDGDHLSCSNPSITIDVIDESGARVRLRAMTRPPDLKEIDEDVERHLIVVEPQRERPRQIGDRLFQFGDRQFFQRLANLVFWWFGNPIFFAEHQFSPGQMVCGGISQIISS